MNSTSTPVNLASQPFVSPPPLSDSLRRSEYAAPVEASKRVRWDIDGDVFRGRSFDLSTAFLPEGLTRLADLTFLSASDRRFLNQIQGRTYANIFGLVERYIGAKMLELSRDHWFGDQTALEAVVRFSDEELKHQAMFRRIETMLAPAMPPGYGLIPNPNDVAGFVLGKSTWAVLALTCHIELFTQLHYRASIAPDPELSPLYKDIFLFHWKEESQHAIIDELEWLRADAGLTLVERDSAVDDFIALVGGVDGILQAQALADVDYFVSAAAGRFDASETQRLRTAVLKAYRYQYILSGAEHPRFLKLLGRLLNEQQITRINTALAGLRA
ncbi:MAG TPA: hypothetical protein VER96_03175 [Polyangiaceae bacterium]|nr:hypothetical protein [Polyangiaceae bacterium]